MGRADLLHVLPVSNKVSFKRVIHLVQRGLTPFRLTHILMNVEEAAATTASSVSVYASPTSYSPRTNLE